MSDQAKNIGEFLRWVSGLRKHFGFKDEDPMQPWFRGQRADHQLLPKLYRENRYGDSTRRKKYKIEDEIFEEFTVRAPILLDTVPAPTDDWDWLFLMQHFGVPTRLLDWTEGALLALYFAVRDNPGYYDAAVWALDPYELNKKAIGKEWIIPPSASGVSNRDKNKVRPWLPNRFKRKTVLPKCPVAIYPSHTARRISTQRSCFTIHGTDLEGLDILEKKKSHYLTKIIIPVCKVQLIRKELDACGIDESTIFPDLEGLSKSIHLRWLKENREPHRNVYTRLRPSPIHGVGVFAIKRIKKGTLLFSGDNEEMVWVEQDNLSQEPNAIRKLYYDFAVKKEGLYGCPISFNRLTMAWYLNEPRTGDRPNVEGDPETYEFRTLREIAAGEELTVNYDRYSEHPQESSGKTEKT